jgi:hypothetical protein
MRRDASGPRDRVLAGIEIPALGIWLGSLVGFAFVEAPLAFRIVAPIDVARFSELISGTLELLTRGAYVLGAIAFIVAILRASNAGDRTWDIVRAFLVAIALALSAYHQRVIVHAMLALADVNSPAYRALHARSMQIYGAVVGVTLVALILAAVRRSDQ